MIPSGLAGFLEEVQSIAATADRERLLTLFPVFAAEYPDIAATIERAANSPDGGQALEVICKEYPVLRVLLNCAPADWSIRFSVSVHYLHKTLHGRIQNGKLQP